MTLGFAAITNGLPFAPGMALSTGSIVFGLYLGHITKESARELDQPIAEERNQLRSIRDFVGTLASKNAAEGKS